MLVDDEPDITSTLKRGLESHGYQVSTFNQPIDASQDDALQYDAAVLDIRMPGMIGFQLARLLWQRNDKLQVCFLSAFEINAVEAKIAMPNLKSHCFISKPVTASTLVAHIQMHLENR